MNGRVGRTWAMVASAAFAATMSGWLAFGSVRAGVGWPTEAPQPVRSVIRLADEAMAATGIDAGWRLLAWAGAVVALAGGFLLTWLALSAFAEPDPIPDEPGQPDA